MDAPAVSREYRAEDRALLLRLYQRLFWDRLVRALPRRLTPNTITLFGESCALLAAPCAWGAAHGRPILYLASGVLLFLYMTADNVDGQHARRTGQTSALGEFLDHGLDGAASCAILFCSAFALRVSGTWLAALVALGSLGFGGIFWAQYRTGTLVTPRISAMEGVTGASLFQFAMLAAGEPSWMRFSPGTWNVASVLLFVLLLCYAYAILSPVLRAWRAGAKLAELLAPLGAAALAVAFAALGAGGVASSLISALYVADVVCRMILLRRAGARHTFARPLDVLLVLPLALALAGAVPADLAAWSAAAFALGRYATTFVTGARAIVSGAPRPRPPVAREAAA